MFIKYSQALSNNFTGFLYPQKVSVSTIGLTSLKSTSSKIQIIRTSACFNVHPFSLKLSLPFFTNIYITLHINFEIQNVSESSFCCKLTRMQYAPLSLSNIQTFKCLNIQIFCSKLTRIQYAICTALTFKYLPK